MSADHDEGATAMQLPKDIGFNLEVLEKPEDNLSVHTVFSENKNYEKHCVLFFNPPLKPEQTIKLKFTYSWENGIKNFMTGSDSRVDFKYTCSQPYGLKCNFRYAIYLPENCVWVGVERYHQKPNDQVKDAVMKKGKDHILWEFHDEEFLFKEEKDNEKRVVTFVLKNIET